MRRRHFLTLPLALLVAPLSRAWALIEPRKGEYSADIAILYRMFSLYLPGTVDEVVDRDAGRYDVTISGEGSRIANRIESHGMLQGGRWVPTRASSWFQVVGREERTNLVYDYVARTAEYRYRGETFLLGRTRVAEDVLALPAAHVDDAVSAILNYADGRWLAAADGSLRTQVIRRRHGANEGLDDAEKVYRAELIPVVLKMGFDPESRKPTALFDLSGFSSWARADRPARIVFGSGRRPELIAASLIFGTSVTVRLR